MNSLSGEGRPDVSPGPSAVKGAVFLDLGVERAFLVETEATAGKELLCRISAMVVGF